MEAHLSHKITRYYIKLVYECCNSCAEAWHANTPTIDEQLCQEGIPARNRGTFRWSTDSHKSQDFHLKIPDFIGNRCLVDTEPFVAIFPRPRLKAINNSICFWSSGRVTPKKWIKKGRGKSRAAPEGRDLPFPGRSGGI